MQCTLVSLAQIELIVEKIFSPLIGTRIVFRQTSGATGGRHSVSRTELHCRREVEPHGIESIGGGGGFTTLIQMNGSKATGGVSPYRCTRVGVASSSFLKLTCR